MGSVGAIAAATNLDSGETRAALGRLEAEGWLVRRDLGGWERILGSPESTPGGDDDPALGEDDPALGEDDAALRDYDVLDQEEPMPDA
jgi:hypothetical protein